MNEYKFRLVLTKEASDFLDSLPLKVYKKISYNINQVRLGVKDPELFQKMENSDGIWELRTRYEPDAFTTGF